MRALITSFFLFSVLIFAASGQDRENAGGVDDLRQIEDFFLELREQNGREFSTEIAAKTVAAYTRSQLAYNFNLSAVRKAAFCVDQTLAWLYHTKERNPGLPKYTNMDLIELSNDQLTDALEALRTAPPEQTEISSRLVAGIMFYVNEHEPFDGFLAEFSANRDAIYQLYYDGAGEVASEIDRTGCFVEIDMLGEQYAAYDRELRGFYATIADWLPNWQ